MSKRRKIIYILIIGFIVLGLVAWYFFIGNSTTFNDNEKKIVFTETGDKEVIVNKLTEEGIISNGFLFKILANKMKVFEKLKPGRFVIKKGTTALELARLLRNNQQANLKLVINKLRTTNDLVKLLGKNLEKDTAFVSKELDVFFATNKIGITSTNFQAFIIPNTYEFYWNTTIEKIMQQLFAESEKFWKSNNRVELLQQIGFSKIDIITIASIVEEETNYAPEKGNIASVYINRVDKKMRLGADPTIKFALNNFALKRVLNVHLQVESPYNTYRNAGLPPGPICTPSIKTIDATLQAPRTNYLFFVANAQLNGTHHFSTNYVEHEQYAKLYRAAVSKYLANQTQ